MQTPILEFHSVIERIREARDAHPTAVALSYGHQQLTYAELVHRSTQFSRYLIRNGLTPGQPVAICMERSFDWIVAALGTMQAGGAYVPLDPTWPDARLRTAVTDSGAGFLVARTTMLHRLELGVQGIDPARDATEIARTSSCDCAVTNPQSLAYIIYTSGTSGAPKGVEITHANLNHLIRWHLDAFRLTRADRASHLAGLGFDAAVWEIWPTLCAGARLCLAGETVRTSPELLQNWLVREQISIAFVPTVLASRLIQMRWPTTVALRFLLTGGDTLLHGPGSQLPFEVVNNYGPTECTVVATSTVVKAGASGLPPIGHAIAGAKVYLLDESGAKVAPGAEGEIFIGGDGVGRGYRNLPGLTEECFLPDPFSDSENARMYRSGDRGILREDGEIEFRSRRDRQAKIRGHRVELDEIGNLLCRHEAIDFATVILRPSDGGDATLAAYVFLKEGEAAIGPSELQQYLMRNLPEYMIPTVFYRLRSIPLTSSGKLDLGMLSASQNVEILKESTAVEPSTPTEEKLLEMVRELLRKPTVGVEDNFFLAGGHSLLGMQLIMRLRQSFDLDLTLPELFKAPTVRRLAVVLETKLIDAIEAMSDEETEAYLAE